MAPGAPEEVVRVPILEEAKSYGEQRFYRFGLHLGLANLVKNGMPFGVRKTLGKITQPINSYTRFPEYFFMEKAIRAYAEISPKARPMKILDVGSPKCFGLYLAHCLYTEVVMTDISPLNLDEYRLMWEPFSKQAKGRALFALQDARSLEYDAEQFDVVYSMSVVEHIEGPCGDSQGLGEMIRVLRPGGLLLLSVPYGNTYVEQWRRGFANAVRKTKDQDLYFFQRIYDKSALQGRIVQHMNGVRLRSAWTIWRSREFPAKVYGRLGENLRGLLGFMNPWISSWVNRSAVGILEEIPSAYGAVHSSADLYGDLVLVGEKEFRKQS